MTINELMEDRNISQYRLSEDSGIAYTTINDICSGKAQLEKCSIETIYRISKVLGVSVETLVDVKSNSYVSRMKTIDKGIQADAFVCQLSTNDATKEMLLGEISESFNLNDFDTQAVAGAIEYIIAYARNTWDCLVIFYTQAKYDSEHYGKMVDLLLEIQKKWDITVIDFWNDEEINNITEEQREIYLIDHIHPTKAGYKEWWLLKFQETLYEVIGK